MLRLYLVRHGDAEPAREGVPDDRRDLTAFGLRQAQALAIAFSHVPGPPTLVLTSPALRARRTAGIIAEGLSAELVEDSRLSTRGDMPDLLEAIAERISSPEAASGLMAVGHNPTFSDLVARLSGEGRSNGLRTGDCACLAFADGFPGVAHALRVIEAPRP